MVVHLIHGFNVTDGGRGTITNLRDYFLNAIVHSIGLVGLFDLRWKNKQIVKSIKPFIGPDDVLIGHSNGALIIQRLLESGVRPKACIFFNASIRCDTRFPNSVPILNLHSSEDWVVQFGRIWSRLVSLGSIQPHGWGAAGRYGLISNQKNVLNFDMAEHYFTYRATGHSDALKPPKVAYWAEFANNWLKNLDEEG